MRETIAVINEKGGVAKTTTAAALASGLRLEGAAKVLCVDLDAQGNLTHIMAASGDGPTAMDVLAGAVPALDAVRRLPQGDIIPAGPDLARAESLIKGARREEHLRSALAPLTEEYNVIILDLPPGLSIVTVAALTAATSALIPVTADILSVKGLAQLYQIVEAVRGRSNPGLRLLGVLLTRYSERSVLRRDMAAVLRETAERIGTRVFKAAIREAVAVAEAQAQQQDLFSYSPKAKVAADYRAFVAEVLEVIAKGGGAGAPREKGI